MSAPDPTPDRPAALEAIGAELRRTAARDATRPGAGRFGTVGRPRAAGRGRLRRPLILLPALLVPAAAVAAVVGGGAIDAPRKADVPREAQVVASTVRVSSIRVVDPAGGPPWTLRTARSAGGQRCLTVGQVDGDRFGIVGLDGRFRTLAAGIVDACADASGPGPWLAGARTLAGAENRPAVTVVGALFPGPAGDATVETAGGGPATEAPRSATRTAGATTTGTASGRTPAARKSRAATDGDGALLAVLPGDAAVLRPVIVTPRAGGGTQRTPLVRSQDTLIAGPRSRWRVESSGTPRSRACVQLVEDVPETGATQPALIPPTCGDLRASPAGFAVRRFARGAVTRDATERRNRFGWDPREPSVVAVWGVADDRVADVTLEGAPGGPRTVLPTRTAIRIPDGIGSRVVPAADRPTVPRAFAFVVDGRTDPAALVVRLRLRDGRALVRRGSTATVDTDGRPLAYGPQPPFRAPRTPAPAHPPAPATPRWRAVPGTDRTLRAVDPTGGDPWLLRVRSAVDRRGRRGFCVLVLRRTPGGVVRRAEGEDGPARAPAPGTVGDCRLPREVGRRGLVLTRVALRGARTDHPSTTSIAVYGFAAPGAKALRLLARDGRPSTHPVAADGAFLVVRPASALHARDLGWENLDAAGRVRPGSPGLRRAMRPDDTARLSARAPDPDGLPPWGVFAGARGENCAATGQIAGDAVGVISPARGLFFEYSRQPCGGDGRPEELARNVVTARTTALPASLWPTTREATAAARVARRTLPGRTVVVLHARSDVRRIRLRTSRDVRTLVPRGPGHVALAVYDGRLEGDLGLEATLADGRTWRADRPRGG